MRRSALATVMEFLKYAPRGRDSRPNYTNFLDNLGFERTDPAIQAQAYQYRNEFIADVKHHVSLSNLRCLCRDDDVLAFEKMISDFLSKYGSKYWGPSKRDHLAEKDSSKGFLYPRDAERKGSR